MKLKLGAEERNNVKTYFTSVVLTGVFLLSAFCTASLTQSGCSAYEVPVTNDVTNYLANDGTNMVFYYNGPGSPIFETNYVIYPAVSVGTLPVPPALEGGYLFRMVYMS